MVRKKALNTNFDEILKKYIGSSRVLDDDALLKILDAENLTPQAAAEFISYAREKGYKLDLEYEVTESDIAAVKEEVDKTESEDYENLYRLYLEEVGRNPLLSNEEIVRLIRRYHENGDIEAWHKIIVSNLRLVISIALRFKGRGLSIMDLIEEGNLGLIKAIENFDYRKNAYFSTYAIWWIYSYIQRAVSLQKNLIRLPLSVVYKMYTVRKAIQEIREETGHEPTVEDIAEKTGLTRKSVIEIFTFIDEIKSLDEEGFGPDRQLSIGDIIADDREHTPEVEFISTLKQEQLDRLLRQLEKENPRAKEILAYRYGLDDKPKRTLQELSDMYGISKERIRQIEIRALRRLKELMHEQGLEDLFKFGEEES